MSLVEELDGWAAGRDVGYYPHPENGRAGTVLLRSSADRIRALEATGKDYVAWYFAVSLACAVVAGAGAAAYAKQGRPLSLGLAVTAALLSVVFAVVMALAALQAMFTTTPEHVSAEAAE